MTPLTEDDATNATKAARAMYAEWQRAMGYDRAYNPTTVEFFARHLRAYAEASRAQPNADAVQIVRNLIASICSDGNSDELRIAQEIVAALRPDPNAVPSHTTGYQPPAAAVQGRPAHGASVDGVPVAQVAPPASLADAFANGRVQGAKEMRDAAAQSITADRLQWPHHEYGTTVGWAFTYALARVRQLPLPATNDEPPPATLADVPAPEREAVRALLLDRLKPGKAYWTETDEGEAALDVLLRSFLGHLGAAGGEG